MNQCRSLSQADWRYRVSDHGFLKCCLLIFLFLWRYYYVKNGKPSPGFLFGVFLFLIFGARFFIEFLKEPQVGFEKGMALNMGQLLSIPLVIAGIILILYSKGKLSFLKK